MYYLLLPLKTGLVFETLTLNQGYGDSPKRSFFALICTIFLLFLRLSYEKRKKKCFNLHLACAALKQYSKYKQAIHITT